jgi:hypothetical protein
MRGVVEIVQLSLPLLGDASRSLTTTAGPIR